MDGLTIGNLKPLNQQSEDELRSGMLFYLEHGDDGVILEAIRVQQEAELKAKKS